MARRYENSRDIRRYLASLIPKVECGELSPRVSDSLTRIANALLIAIKTEVSERELELLESIDDQLKGVKTNDK